MQARLIAALAAACAATALGLPAAAAASSGAQDSVVGDGTVTAGATLGGTSYTHVRFSAHSGTHGEDPQGFVTGTYSATTLSDQLLFPSGTFTGSVVCMSVMDNRADVMAKLDQPVMTATGPADMIDLSVADNGEPTGGENVDQIATGFYLQGTHVLGECNMSNASYHPGGNGNAVVTDAS